MSRLSIVLLTVSLLLIADFIASADLTREEAAEYIQKVDPEKLIDDVIKLDKIENSEPILLDPGYTGLILDNGDLIIFPLNPYVIMTIGGHLEYNIHYKSYVLPGFYPNETNKKLTYFFTGLAVGFAGGFLMGYFGGK